MAKIRLPVQKGIQQQTCITFWYVTNTKMNQSKNEDKVSIKKKEITMDKYIHYKST